MGQRIFELDENFFNKINTNEKAYFLGLFYADGNVMSSIDNYTYYMKLSLNSIDEHIIESFRKALKTEKPIYKSNIKNTQMSTISISSKLMGPDLINLGCMPNKAKLLKYPTEEQVPDEFMVDFIRGYFDGDGCVWEGKRKVMRFKDKTRKLGYKDRIVHNVKINFSGNTNFITGLRNYLISKLPLNNVKINIRKDKVNCAMLEYSGRKQLSIFYNYFYNNNVCFKRKKEKFESIVLPIRANI